MFDRLLSSFLRDIHLIEEVAFLDYNLAPLSLRRDIGVLGFLHKRVFGHCHPALCDFLPFDVRHSTWHDKQLQSNLESVIAFHPMYHRSLWGAILIYNRLFQALFDSATVKDFQKQLTQIARSRCMQSAPDWQQSFSSCSSICLRSPPCGPRCSLRLPWIAGSTLVCLI